MFVGKRDVFLRLGEALCRLADFGKGFEVLVRKLAADNEAPQRVALPSGETTGPVEDFMQFGHHRLRAPRRNRGYAGIGVHDAPFRPRNRSPSDTGSWFAVVDLVLASTCSPV